MIDQKLFLQIIDTTPLVSIDLILLDADKKTLLGKRTNRPAQNYWFVPGGRIRKNEKLADAIIRISQTELNTSITIKDAQLLGAYDHIYDDNFAAADKINTHYVALGYQVIVDSNFKLTADTQHSEFQWWSQDKLLQSKEVHQNTKAYFQN